MAQTYPCPLCGNYFEQHDLLSKFHICRNCAKEVSGFEEWKQHECDTISVGVCEQHGFFITDEMDEEFQCCPVCIDEKDSVVAAEERELSPTVQQLVDFKRSPFFVIQDGVGMLPIRSYPDPEKIVNNPKICECCGRPYVSHTVGDHFCGDCWIILECKKCDHSYVVTPERYTTFSEDTSSCGCNNDVFLEPADLAETTKIEITPENVYEMSYPGVFSIEDANGDVYQVSDTDSIRESMLEMFHVASAIKSGALGDFFKNEKLENGIEDLSFYLLSKNPSKKARIEIAVTYAVQNKAKLWKAKNFNEQQLFDQIAKTQFDDYSNNEEGKN